LVLLKVQNKKQRKRESEYIGFSIKEKTKEQKDSEKHKDKSGANKVYRN
jgi:hypothetical protein